MQLHASLSNVDFKKSDCTISKNDKHKLHEYPHPYFVDIYPNKMRTTSMKYNRKTQS